MWELQNEMLGNDSWGRARGEGRQAKPKAEGGSSGAPRNGAAPTNGRQQQQTGEVTTARPAKRIKAEPVAIPAASSGRRCAA